MLIYIIGFFFQRLAWGGGGGWPPQALGCSVPAINKCQVENWTSSLVLGLFVLGEPTTRFQGPPCSEL